MRKVIVNTTPLIALADIGQLDLLRQLYTEVMIPSAVDCEIISEPARTLVSAADWIKIIRISGKVQKSSFSSRLHSGEIEVILLAQETNADLLIVDDNAAKKTAKFLGFPVTGTMGVLLRAKREGLITEVKPLLEWLIEDGLFVSPPVKNYVMEQAGEK